MNSKKVISYLTLPHPISGHRKVLDEKSFRLAYLDSDLTMQQVVSEFGVSLKCMQTSVKYYKQVLPEEVKAKTRKSYTNSAYRREPGIHQRKHVKVDKDKLISLLSEGRTEYDIAEKFGVAPQTIRKNIRSYGLLVPSRKARNISDDEWLHLEWANQLVPGLLDSAYRGNDDPNIFFHLLYDAFVLLCRILWTIQKIGRRYNHHLVRARLPRDHIGWRINKQEIILSERLRELGISHIREYFWAKDIGKNFSADLYIPESNLLIEINGNVHSIGFVINRDKEKSELVRKLGYKRLEFLSSEIDKELDRVVEVIKMEMRA